MIKGMLRDNKSQIKIQEMSFMLLALVLFFAIVFLFYLTISSSGLKRNVQEMQRQSSIAIVSRLADAPEFNCEQGMTACIDTDKLLAFIAERAKYSGFWGISVKGLVVEKVFSSDLGFNANRTIECTKATYPLCNRFTIINPQNNTIADASFVSLCRKEYKNNYLFTHCSLGKAVIYTEKGSII